MSYYHSLIQTAVPGNPLWNNLIGYYTSDNTPNTSIGSVNGTLVNGTTYATGKINNAFSFDGVNDYVDLDDNYDFTFGTPFSISTWFYTNSATGYQSLFSKINPTAPQYKGYQLQLEGSQIRMHLIKDFGTSDLILKRRTQTLSSNTWYHITVTYDGSKNSSGLKIYIDGSDGSYDVNTNALTSNITNVGIDAVLGCSYNNSYFVNGRIDETAIFDAELTSAQVTELYNSGNGLQYGASYGALTTAWITATGETDNTIITALNTLETDLTTYGILSKMKALYPFVGGTATKHKFNFMDARDLDVAFRLVFSGGGTHSSNGYLPNATNAYADTKLNFSTDLPSASPYGSDLSVNYYSRTNTNATEVEMGVNSDLLIEIRTSGTSYLRSGSGLVSFSDADSLGLYTINRLNNTDQKGYKNGILKGTALGTTGIYLNYNILIGAWGGASPTYYSSKECAFASIGNGLDATETANLYTAIQAFQTTLSRQV